MKAPRPIVSFSLGLLTFCAAAQADMVIDWNSVALDAIKAEQTSPPEAARHLAILHVAIFDACNGIGQNYEPYFVTGKPPGVASKEAAIAAAARRVLVSLYPAHRSVFDALYQFSVERIRDGPGKRFGLAWGERVAGAILESRGDDGAESSASYTVKEGPGMWVPTPPRFAAPLLPGWSWVVPFAMQDGAQFRPPPPPLLDSAEWAADFNLTKALGGANSSTRSTEQTLIALFWADGGGTVTPPGHWNVIARDVARQRGNTLEQNARLFALLNIAEADAGIVAWDCKYAFNLWRPVTAIRNADLDGNASTASQPAWTPLLATPPFPEYTSGHSTFSGAAAAVLAVYFGSDQFAFTTESEDLPGVSRTFTSFSEAAAEAGMSRIYGGIHFMSANRNGLFSGAALGRHVAQHFLRPKHGRSHRGH